MAVRAITHAMKTVQAIAENDKIPDDQKAALSEKVLAAGAAATVQPPWDNWAQRLVAGGLTVIGVVLGVFVGIAVIKGDQDINAAYTSALTAVIGGLAGMFTQKALSSGNAGEGPDGGGGGGDDGLRATPSDAASGGGAIQGGTGDARTWAGSGDPKPAATAVIRETSEAPLKEKRAGGSETLAW